MAFTGEGNALGKNLRELRQARNLKQEDVANALDVPPPTYSSWERGKTQPDVETILLLYIRKFLRMKFSYIE